MTLFLEIKNVEKNNSICGDLPIMSLCGCPVVSSLGTSEFSRSLRNSSRLSASPPFLLFLSSSGTSGVRHLVNIYGKVNGDDLKIRPVLRTEPKPSAVRSAHLQQPGVPQGLSGQREKFLHAAGLLPHHQLLGRRRQVQRGHDVGVIGQLRTDCFAVQLLHAVHNQLPLALRLGLLHCSPAQRDTSAQVNVNKFDKGGENAACMYSMNPLHQLNVGNDLKIMSGDIQGLKKYHFCFSSFPILLVSNSDQINVF